MRLPLFTIVSRQGIAVVGDERPETNFLPLFTSRELAELYIEELGLDLRPLCLKEQKDVTWIVKEKDEIGVKEFLLNSVRRPGLKHVGWLAELLTPS